MAEETTAEIEETQEEQESDNPTLEELQLKSALEEGLFPLFKKLNDDKTALVDMTDDEILADTNESNIFNVIHHFAKQIEEQQEYLESTDYIVIKLAEGVATKEEYALELEKRVTSRAEINRLTEIVDALELFTK